MKTIKNTIIIILITCLLLEIIIRLCGVKPYKHQQFSIASIPELCLIPNAQFGFALNPGKYKVTMNEQIHYTCTHNSDSLRNLGKNENEKLKIDFHGCSFTYGMSVDDSLTFPFLLQQTFPNYKFRNFAVPGFGNIQALLRLRNQLQNGDIPNLLLLCYADFHDERNALNLNYRQSLFNGFQNANEKVKPLFTKSKMPFYDVENGIQYCDWQSIYKNWKGRTHFATVNAVQNAVDKMKYAAIDEKVITHHILLDIQALCEANDIELILIAITKSESTNFTLNFCEQQNIKTFDIGLSFPSEEYSNLPYDIHPNKLAHKYFADRITDFIEF